MYKKLLTAILAAANLMLSASLYAHNDAPKAVSPDEKRKTAEQKQDAESWDSFMQAINEQDAKKEKTSETNQDNKHKH